jgi:NAD(P)-dependent dehydrogenase (short-subunit alcohol dehydrogenase family)
VTKHAALAFAEWMAISYGDRGIKVSCLCPQGVNTPMIGGPVSASQNPSIESESDQIVNTAVSAVRAGGDILEADQVAQVMVDAIRNEEFLVLPHPEVLTYAKRKAEDRARWIAGMRKFQARLQ